jgi:hypothetical protein
MRTERQMRRSRGAEQRPQGGAQSTHAGAKRHQPERARAGDTRAFVLSLERFNGSLTELTALLQDAAQQRLLTPQDAQRLEGALSGRLNTRALDPAAVGLSRELRPSAARHAEALPEAFTREGISAAAVGQVVLTRPGAVDVAAGRGLPLLRHELAHVQQHETGAVGAHIHFDVGTTSAETTATRAASTSTTTAEPNARDTGFQDQVRSAHEAELRQIVRYLRGHTSDDDVFGVLQILSHWDRATIQAAWFAIERMEEDGGWLEDLADNLELEHFQRHPRELAATLNALPPDRRYHFILEFTSTGIFNGVNAAEATAVLYLLQDMPRPYLERFAREDRGRRYQRLNDALPAAERARLASAVNPEVERRLAAEEQTRRRQAEEERRAREASAAVETEIAAIRSQLSTGITDWAVTDSDARQVFERLKNLCDTSSPTPPPLLRSVVRTLEQDGSMQSWIDNMPEDTAYAPSNVGAFIQVLSCRPPESAIRHAEGLLSYGLFDWAITDAEAMLAYHLIRALPETAQHAFRMRDENQWFLRMEENLAASVRSGEAGHTEGGYGLVDSAADRERRAADQATVTAQAEVLTALRGRIDDAGDEAACLALLGELSALAEANRGGMVRDLDRDGHIEKLLNDSGTARWRPEHRSATLTVLRDRDPVRNMALIRELMSYGLFDWEINCNEARLAYECIRALAPDMRAEFVAMNPTWFDRIDANISLELRQSREFGMYDGGASGDRSRLLGQLLAPEIWLARAPAGSADAPPNLSRLRMVLLMVRQAGALADAWSLVQQHWSDSPEHTALFVEVGYTAEGPATEDVVDRTDSNTLSQIGAGFSVLGGTESGVAGLIAYGMGLSDSAHLHGVAISDAQRGMGGHIGGITFAETTHSENDAARRDVGEIDFDVDEEIGEAVLQADSLPVQSVNTLSASGASIRTGPCTILGPNIRVKWGTTENPEASIRIALERFEINDLIAVQEDRMVGVQQVVLTGLLLEGSRPDGPLREAQMNDVLQVFERIVSLLAWPLLGPLGVVSITRDFAGLIQHIRDTFSEHTNFRVQLGGLSLTGVADSRGGHVDSASIGAVDVSLTLSQAGMLRTRAEAIRTQANGNPSAEQLTQIEALETAASAVEAQEHRRDALRAQLADPRNTESERAAIQAQLTPIEAELNRMTVSGSVGSAQLSGLDYGGMSASALNIGGITLSGSVAGDTNPVEEGLTDRGDVMAMSRLSGGEAATPDRHAELTLTASTLTGENLRYQSTERRDVALQATIEPLLAKETAGTLLETERTTLERARAELADVERAADELAGLERRFGTLNETERSRYRELEEFMRAAPSVSIDHLDLQGASLSGDTASDAYSFRAESGTLRGVTAGDYHVDSVSGTDFGVGVSQDGGGRLDLDAGSLTATGVDQRSHVDVVRGRIDELQAMSPPSPTQSGELQRLQAELGRYTALQARVAELRPIVAANAEDWDAAHELARKEAELAGWETSRHADTVTATDIHARLTGTGNVTSDDWAMPTGGLALQSSREDGRILGSLTATGVRSDGAEIGTVTVSDVSGRVEQVDADHLEIQQLNIGNVTVGQLHWAGGTTDVRIGAEATLTNVMVDASVSWHVVEDHGARTRQIETVHVRSLTVGSVTGTDIHARTASFELDLAAGSLGGISVTEFDLASMTFENVHLDSANVEGLRHMFSGSGNTTTIDQLSAGGLDVSSLTAGVYTIDLADLDGEGIATDMEGLGVTIRRLENGSIAGMTVDQNTGTASFPEINLGRIDFSRALYDAPPMHVHVRNRAQGHNVTIRGRLDRLTNDERRARGLGEDASSIESLFIDELRIPTLDLEDVSYIDDTKGYDIRVASGTMTGMVLRGYNHTTGALDLHIDDSNLSGLAAQIGPSLRFDGNLAWQGIDYGVLSDGTTSVDLDHVSTADLLVTYRDGGNVNVVNLAGSRDISGHVEMRGNTTTLRDMDLGSLHLGHIDWRAGTKHLTSLAEVVLGDTRFSATLVQGEDGSLTEVHVTALHVGLVDCEHLVYQDGDTRVEFNPARHPERDLQIVNIDVAELNWTPDAGLTSSRMEIDRIQSTLAVRLGSSLQARAELDARDIHLTLSEGGRVVASVADLSLEASGTASGTEFGVSAEHVNTGEVSVSPTEIRVPNLVVPTLSLTSLFMDSPTLSVRLLDGGHVTMSEIMADLTVNRVARPEGDARSSITSIVINDLRIPTTTASGLEIELKDKGITLVLASDATSTINDLVTQAFEITLPETEDGAMGLVGELSSGRVDLRGLGVFMGSDHVWADVSTPGIRIGSLDDGSREIDVSTLTATNVHGEVGGGAISVRTAVIDSVNVTTDADGETTTEIGGTRVEGLVFDDGNLRLDMAEAHIGGLTLPPSGDFVIPSVDISNADFQIRDIPALSSGGGSGAGPADWDFLNTLNGHINMLVNYTVESSGDDVAANITMPVTNGAFNFSDLSGDALPWYLDLEMEGNQLIIEENALGTNQMSWNLVGDEIALARDSESVRIGTLVREQGINARADEAEAAARAARGEAPAAAAVTLRSIQNIDVDLSMSGASTIDLGAAGKIHLGGDGHDGVVGLHVTGQLANGARHALTLDLGEVHASLEDFQLSNYSVNVQSLVIGAVNGATVDFTGLSPRAFRGLVTSATAAGIRVSPR